MIVDMGKRGPKPSMDRRDEALQLRLDGLTFGAIAERLGISRQRVQQLLAPPRDVRDSVVIEALGKCSSCQLFVGTAGHVHHIQATTIEEENYNDRANLTLLCPSCHRIAHKGRPQSRSHQQQLAERSAKSASVYVEVGERIRLARRRLGLTQRGLGERLGVSHAAVSDLERGVTRPNLDGLIDVATALCIPVEQLLILDRRPQRRDRGGDDGD